MTIADTLFVSQLGVVELAAVGLSASAVWVVMAFPQGLLGAVRVHVARASGAGDAARSHAFAWQGVWVALAAGALAMAGASLSRELLTLMQASSEVLPLADDYLVIRILSAPLVFVMTALSGAFQGRGDTRTPMAATVLANLVNIGLDPVFIFGLGPVPALGVGGAAIATALGLAVGVAVLVGFASQDLLRRPMGPRWHLLRALAHVGAPQAVQLQLDVVTWAAFSALLAWSGDAHLAAHVIVVRIVLVSFLPCHALGEAAGVLVGQALGAGLESRARRAHWVATQQALAIMLACGVAFVTIPSSLIGVFGATPEVDAIARQVLLLYAAIQLLDAVLTVTVGSLTGAGDTRFVMALSVGGAWLVKLPVSCLLVLYLELGALGAWLGLAAEIVTVSVVAILRIRGAAWLRQSDGLPEDPVLAS